jgi:bifunctional enzyme CysN/CysC
MFAEREFVEVFVDTPLEECIRRDSKGLYAKALRGEIPNFTGISAPYEPPEHPEFRLCYDDSRDGRSMEEQADLIMKAFFQARP